MKYEIETVEVKPLKRTPKDYHCNCDFCKPKTFRGVLIRPDGTPYSKLERRQYYNKQADLAHIAKTPLHVARWCIQEFSKPKDWVLDPTIGVGTTAVEAMMLGRCAAGVELEFAEYAQANVNYVWKEQGLPKSIQWNIVDGDARDIRKHLGRRKFGLIVNNPPYSGDQHQKIFGKPSTAFYLQQKGLGRMKETPQYWDDIRQIYEDSLGMLKAGGHFCIGVKDMVQNKAPYLLHKMYGEILLGLGMEFVCMALLPHYPPTLFMNTYNKRFPDLDIKVPAYQTILVFRKEK